MSIFDRINCSYAHGLSFGGYRMRQISTRICLSREHFGEAIFFVDEKNTYTVSPEFSGLHQINYGGQTFECSCLLLPSIVYDQMGKKIVK